MDSTPGAVIGAATVVERARPFARDPRGPPTRRRSRWPSERRESRENAARRGRPRCEAADHPDQRGRNTPGAAERDPAIQSAADRSESARYAASRSAAFVRDAPACPRRQSARRHGDARPLAGIADAEHLQPRFARAPTRRRGPHQRRSGGSVCQVVLSTVGLVREAEGRSILRKSW